MLDLMEKAPISLSPEARRALDVRFGVPANWVRPSGADMDVAVIGGGQNGVAIAFALRRKGIHRVRVFDAAAEGSEGVWTTIARMRTLRTNKDIPGFEQGIPELTFRAWYAGTHGDEAFSDLGRAPRGIWQDYLTWYRRAVGVTVEWQHGLTAIGDGGGGGLALTFESPGGVRRMTARKVVLATGLDGFGATYVPEAISNVVPRTLFQHTNEDIDFGRLQGRHIGVFGAGASAFDAAASALEHGAASVAQFVRGTDLAPSTDGYSHSLITAERLYFDRYPDETRFNIVSGRSVRASAPDATIDRARRHKAFSLHFGISADAVRYDAETGKVAVVAGGRSHVLDALLLGTGYVQGASAARRELSGFADNVLEWRDRVVVAKGRERFGRFPYLGAGFELQEKRRGETPWIEHVHVFTAAALVSHGLHVGDIGTAYITIPKLTEGISRSLFEMDFDSYRDESKQSKLVKNGVV